MRTHYALAAVLLIGCSSTGTVETSVSSTALTLPDGRFSEDAHLTVTIREVAIHIGDGAETESEDAGWTTVVTGPAEIDLYQSAQVSQLLGASPAPAGKVSQVRLILDDDPVLTVAGLTFPVSCPSCTETGIKIVTHGALEVPAGGTLLLTLDFNQNASLHTDGHGGYILQPTVRI